MKTIVIIFTMLLLFLRGAPAQTAETYISQGRAFLAAHDLTNADSRFALAVAASPNHATGNVFRAATRLLTLQNRPATAAFLDRLGLATTGRDLYNWTADFPRDIHGIPLAPTNLSGAELTAFLRTNVLPEIIAADANLAVVTDKNFVLNLTSNETAALAVTLDYGDIALMRAVLKGAQYAAYTIHSWNVDEQLATLRSIVEAGSQTAEEFLRQRPNLFTFATTNDLSAARQAFSDGVTLYMNASGFIRNRPTNVTRLFNLDPEETQSEADFRTTIGDLLQSLNGAVALQLFPEYSVNLSNHFAGRLPPRGWLPQIAGNSVVAGTIPDVTFGGMVGGAAAYQLEGVLGDVIPFISKLSTPQREPDGSAIISMHGLDQVLYVLQASTNLQTWTTLGPVFVRQGNGSFHDTSAAAAVRYYRVIDYRDYVTVSGTVRDIVTGNPISHAAVTVTSYYPFYQTTNLLTDASGNYSYVFPSSPYGFFYSQVAISAAGYSPVQLYGVEKYSSWQTYLVPPGYVPPNDFFANRITLVGPTNHVVGLNANASKEFGEPNHDGNPGGRSLWWSWTATASGVVTVDTIGSDIYTVLAIYTGNSLESLAVVASDEESGGNHTSKVSFFAQPGVTYQIAVDGFYGYPGTIFLNLRQATQTPSGSGGNNDLFANRLPIFGTVNSVSGNNTTATKETFEPNHAGNAGGKSVWWTWTAPATGAVTLDTIGSSFDTLLAVYRGNSVSGLSLVASDDDSGGNSQSQVTFAAEAGVTYQIAVDGYNGAGGSIILNLY